MPIPHDNLLLEHARSPYHRGTLAAATGRHKVQSRSCGDCVELQLQIDPQGTISQAYFLGRGCFVSQGAASILCEHIEGKPVTEVENLLPAEMLDLLGVRLTPRRQQCALLGFRALKSIIYRL